MRPTNNKSRHKKEVENQLLKLLSLSLRRLQEAGMLTQADLERLTGVDQTTISRARSGKLKRVTAKVLVIKKCVDTRLQKRALSRRFRSSVAAFLNAGGNEIELTHIIQQLTRLINTR